MDHQVGQVAGAHEAVRNASRGSSPRWIPTAEQVAATHIASLLSHLKLADFRELHRWSAANRKAFWKLMLQRLNIRFISAPGVMFAYEEGDDEPRWLPDAVLNIVDSCFNARPDAPAILSCDETGFESSLTFEQLARFTNRVANGLVALGLKSGDAVAIDMPMTIEAVAAYLGVIRAGGVVVSVADSFAPAEIATRLRIGKAKLVITQEQLIRGGKRLPLYEKVCAAGAPGVIVVRSEHPTVRLRHGDLDWQAFLSENDAFESVARAANDHANILFSSGTTGEPKAIPWTHLTPIKCATDAHVHHDVHPGDVLAWPTNLGWMMGPWLIFASLISGASMALFSGSPATRAFGAFVQDAGVTMLGVVPTLVKTWRSSCCLKGLDWSRITRFSSTGECSNPDDMRWLMQFAGGKPIIEYCGGTEVGGGYISSTMVQPNAPSTFTTPAIGLDLVLLDEDGHESDEGEVFLVGPSIGLSRELLNADHHEIYYAGVPGDAMGRALRRHGDQLRRHVDGSYQALGRSDDTMNLGGIKVSSAEIERVAVTVTGAIEVAAVAVPPVGGGPDRLILFVVPSSDAAGDTTALKTAMQARIAQELNPLFRVHDVVLVDSLPRTASNKVIRRKLRAQYASAE
ncbi:MAG: AMP-binding protein [Phycisphaeraceae bacterium]